MIIIEWSVPMDCLETLKNIYSSFPKAVMVTDSRLVPLWDNGKGVPAAFDGSKLRSWGDCELSLPLDAPATVRYHTDFGRSPAADIIPIEEAGDICGYILQFYSCSDVEELSDLSDHIRFKNNFLGNIRNELASVVYSIEDERQELVQRGDLERLAANKKIRYSILKVFSSTANLNEISKYYNGQYSTQLVDVSKIIQSIAQDLDDAFEENDCRFICKLTDGPIYMKTNSDRLRAAVCNLLVNAYMYCNAEKKECTLCVEKTPDSVVISVSDNGTNADIKALEEYKVPFGAFKNFGPGESLGIAVAACYCNSMGAHLEFSSPLGKQTTARMIFPASCLCEPDSLRAVTPVPPCGAYDLQNCIMAKGFDPLKG